MRILVCPDKFKGSLPAHLVARAMSDGIRDADPRYQVDAAPMADGGDGTVDAFLAAMGGKKQTVQVLDTLGREVESVLGLLPGGYVVLEMAAASGLAMVPEEARNPLYTSSYGTGQLMVQAMEYGCRSVIIGIGGSATNDGGMGLLSALGARFYQLHRGGNAASPACGPIRPSGSIGDLHPSSLRCHQSPVRPRWSLRCLWPPKGCGLSDGGGIGSGPCPVRRSSLPGHGTGYTIHAGLRCSWRRRRRLIRPGG